MSEFQELDIKLGDYTDDEPYLLEPMFVLHDAARDAEDHAVGHAVPLSDGSDALVIALHFTDKEKAQNVFDFLHEMTDGFIPSWSRQQQRTLIDDMLQAGDQRASA